MPTTWFGRLGLFVLVLIVLKLFFKWNISIVGSVTVTILVYAIASFFQSGSIRRDRHSTHRDNP